MRDRTMRRIQPIAALLLAASVAACAAPQTRPTLSAEARSRLLAAATSGASASVPQGALPVLRDTAAQRPNDVVAQEQFAAAAERAELAAEAVAARRQAILAGGRTAPRLIALGRAELRAGEATAAAASFEAAAGLAPGSADAQAGLGLAYDMLGDPARAQLAHRAALGLSPNDWGLLGNLALSQLMGGDPGSAATTLARAETDGTAPRRARHNLGLAFGALGQRTRLVRLLGVDMGRAGAEAEAPDFIRFGAWLAGQPTPQAAVEPAPLAVARR